MPRVRRFSPEQEAELDELHARCLLILDTCAGVEPGAWSAPLREVMERTAAGRSIRGMRTLLRELRGMLAALPAQARRALAAEMGARFGPDALEDRDVAVVAKVRRRGHIRTEAEFRIVSAYADTLSAEPGAQEEYLTLGGLLDRFSAGA